MIENGRPSALCSMWRKEEQEDCGDGRPESPYRVRSGDLRLVMMEFKLGLKAL